LNHDSVREASDFFNSLLVALAALGYGNPPFSQAVQEDTKAMRSPRTTDWSWHAGTCALSKYFPRKAPITLPISFMELAPC